MHFTSALLTINMRVMAEANTGYDYLNEPVGNRDRAVHEPTFGKVVPDDRTNYAREDMLSYPYQNETMPQAIERERELSRQRLEQARHDLDAKIEAGKANHVDVYDREWLEGRDYQPSRLEEARDIIEESQRMLGELYDSDPERFNKMTVREWLSYTKEVQKALIEYRNSLEQARIFQLNLQGVDGLYVDMVNQTEPKVTAKQLLSSIELFGTGALAGQLGYHLNQELKKFLDVDANQTVAQIFTAAREYLHTVGNAEADRRVQVAKDKYLSYYSPQENTA